MFVPIFYVACTRHVACYMKINAQKRKCHGWDWIACIEYILFCDVLTYIFTHGGLKKTVMSFSII